MCTHVPHTHTHAQLDIYYTVFNRQKRVVNNRRIEELQTLRANINKYRITIECILQFSKYSKRSSHSLTEWGYLLPHYFPTLCIRKRKAKFPSSRIYRVYNEGFKTKCSTNNADNGNNVIALYSSSSVIYRPYNLDDPIASFSCCCHAYTNKPRAIK